MSKIILGTVQFGLDYGINNNEGQPTFELVKKILNFASENQIGDLDTADSYGEAQSVLNKYFSSENKNFTVMSKFVWDHEKDFNFHFQATLKVLGVKALEGYYFHRFKDFQEFQFFDQVKLVKEKNLLKYLGVSLYSNEELNYAVKSDEIDIIQLPFNLLDHSNEKQKLLLSAHNKGKKIFVRSVFLQGLFFKDVEKLPVSLLPLKNDLIAIQKISKQAGLTMEELCLGYLKSKNFIDGILIGVDSVEQLKQNLISFKTRLDDEVIRQIDCIDVSNIGLLNPSNWK